MKPEKTIEKAMAVIDNRIKRIEKRKAEIMERWPAELYGTKADSMLDELDEERKALERWKAAQSEAVLAIAYKKAAEAAERVARNGMNAAVSALAVYDPVHADLIHRKYKPIDTRRL